MNRKSWPPVNLSVLTVAAMLSACSALTAPPSPTSLAACPPPPGVALSSNEAVRYYACLSSLSAADVAKEYASASTSFLKTGSDSDRIRLAILLSMPGTEFHSAGGALELVKNFPEGAQSSSSELRGLARLLDILLAEQLRADDTIVDLTKALAAEKMRSGFLQDKIDAVKSLEIDLIPREQP